MIHRELENCLAAAFAKAAQGGCEVVTIEHLLLALLDSNFVIADFLALGVGVPSLKRLLEEHVQKTSSKRLGMDAVDPIASEGFQHVMNRAITYVNGIPRTPRRVYCHDVIASILKETDSRAAQLLKLQGLSSAKIIELYA